MELTEAKLYLRIDYEDENDYIAVLIDTTQIYIDSCVGENYKAYEKLLKLAKLVQYKLISDLYDTKSSMIANNLVRDRIVETIFNKLSNAEAVEI